jgi:hypothetical protein
VPRALEAYERFAGKSSCEDLAKATCESERACPDFGTCQPELATDITRSINGQCLIFNLLLDPAHRPHENQIAGGPGPGPASGGRSTKSPTSGAAGLRLPTVKAAVAGTFVVARCECDRRCGLV